MIIDSLENKRRILHRFLEVCAFEGVNDEVLEDAMQFCQIDVKFKNIIFECGVLDIIELYIDETNENLAKIIDETPNFEKLKIREKIKFALYNFFELQKEHQLALQRIRNFYFDLANFKNTKYGARPSAFAFKNAGKIADFIWKKIGDQSTDFNFYTKRLILSGVIISVFSTFVKDKTPNLEETKAKIDKKIEKVMKIEKFKAKMRGFKGDFEKKSREVLMDDEGNVKSFKEIIKDLPFIRLFN
ncbi:MAG TPA: COQ9 family protein [Rickettsiales bacterium]|nr:COQ9 family protein [Rickettsiales bacterium]